MGTAISANVQQIKRALDVMFRPGDVVELRAFGQKRNTVSGYYDDYDSLARDAVEINRRCGNTYVTLNQVNPDLLARCANRYQQYAQATTSDTQIIHRRWLPIDLDPVRPTGISASEPERDQAKELARSIYRHLVAELGFPKPLVADSGNGIHLLFGLDLPNDQHAAELVSGCLDALAHQFNTDKVVVDVSNTNASRIWKLYGTIALKGDNTSDRPHRLSQLIDVPAELEPVPIEQLELLADGVPTVATTCVPDNHEFDVGQWLADHGVGIASFDDDYRGQLGHGRKWVLERCPWNPDHTNKSAFVIQFEHGPIAAGCHHNGCNGKDWHDLRDLVESQNSASAQPEGLKAHKAHVEKQSGQGDRALKSVMAHQNAWPEPLDEAAFHGLAGEVVRAIEPHSEVDPVATLVQFLTAFGNAAGRAPHFRVESDRHYLKLFIVLVGKTAKARKGTSWGHILRLFRMVDEQWVTDHVANGLSTGEGLIWAVRDEVLKTERRKTEEGEIAYHEVISDAGVKDKRFLCVESEFASTLKVARREGNTLSPVVRNAWDNGDLRTLTKNHPAKATATHISIIGHITEEELRRELTSTEACNGFANRFLWLCVRRSKLLPDGGDLNDERLQPLVESLKNALEAARWIEHMERDEITKTLWHAVYPELSRESPGLFGAITSRAEAQTMRLAAIYAALDSSVMIRRPHLEAALAVWGYVEDSVRYIFTDSLGDPLADEILKALRQHPQGMSRNEIRQMFNRHCSARQLSTALAVLRNHGLADCTKQRTAGRSRELWIANNSAP